MTEGDHFGPSMEMDVRRYAQGEFRSALEQIATEIPLTLMAGEIEIATLQCSPSDLEDLAYGFLFSSGLIGSVAEVLACDLDRHRWRINLELQTTPDPGLLAKRIYTSGCGRGVTYAHLDEVTARLPLETTLQIAPNEVGALARWLQQCSELYRETHGVHTAALSLAGATPEICIDDIGRHNAVDKVIGAGLRAGLPFGRTLLVSSGRVSSEILQKAKRAGVPLILARGGPTHQTVLRARDMGITVIGFARGGGFAIYSHAERIV